MSKKATRVVKGFRKFHIFALLMVLLASWTLSAVMPVEASSVRQSLEQQKASEEQRQKDAEDAKSEAESFLENVGQKTSGLAASAAEVKLQLQNKQAEIEETKDKLEAAKEEARLQSANMSKRIKLIYERGNTSYLANILEAGSFAEMINRTRYASEVFEYDNRILNSYKEKIASIAQLQDKLAEDNKQLASLNEEANRKLAEAQKSMEDAKEEIKQHMNDILDSKKNIAEIDKLLIAQGNSVGTGDAPATSTGQGQTTELQIKQGDAVSLSEEEIKKLATMIYCEAGGEGYAEMLGVGSVICNRIKSSRYPNDLESVLWQNMQFAPTWEGKYTAALERDMPAVCYQAARQAASGYSNVGDHIGFKLASTGIEGIVIGKIVFFG